MNWLDKHYPNGLKVLAYNEVGKWVPGTIACRTINTTNSTAANPVDGIRVVLDAGSYIDYDLGYLTEDGSTGSLVLLRQEQA